jgi:hypothetical protein
LNPRFRTVAEEAGYAPARATLRRTFEELGERDPNFIQQFQTTGFDARITELYLFAALRGAGLDVDSVGDAPDFLVSGAGYEWALEVTTANPSSGAEPPPLPEDRAALQRHLDGEQAVRFGSALYSKLNKRYWELPHVAGKPLVLGIQSFASEDAQQLADTALVDYLYGLRTFGELDGDGRLHVFNADVQEHVGTKTIPSNFFAIPEAAHISAVLWTNSGTVAKFARMGFQEGLDTESISMARVGVRFVMDRDADEGAPFSYEVGARWERWEEGLVIAHNPRALLPLPRSALPGVVHHELGDDGLIVSTLPPFHALRSRTAIVVGV